MRCPLAVVACTSHALLTPYGPMMSASLQPPMRRAYVDILALGVRSLAAYNHLPIMKPKVRTHAVVLRCSPVSAAVCRCRG